MCKEPVQANGLTRHVGLLRMLIRTELNNRNSVESYVIKTINTAHKLGSVRTAINEQ